MVLHIDHLIGLTQIRYSIFKDQLLIIGYAQQTVWYRYHAHTGHIRRNARSQLCRSTTGVTYRKSHRPCAFLRRCLFCRNMQFVSAGRAARLISRLFRICGLMLGGLRFFHRFHFFFFFPVAGLSVPFRRLLLFFLHRFVDICRQLGNVPFCFRDTVLHYRTHYRFYRCSCHIRLLRIRQNIRYRG